MRRLPEGAEVPPRPRNRLPGDSHPGHAVVAAELKALAARGSLRSLFNTSGAHYRKLGLAGKLSKMSPEEAFALLAENGNLVKCPYVSGDGINFTGFDETEWKAAFA